MNVHPHLSTPDPYLLPFSLVWLVLRCLAVFSSARMEHSPGTRYDSPAHYLLNLCCWRVNLVHFPSSPFSPVGKREIEEEVNQARALTYSTKKENCAVVNDRGNRRDNVWTSRSWWNRQTNRRKTQSGEFHFMI